MQELFSSSGSEKRKDSMAPFADRVRPNSLGEVVGQEHLTGAEGPLKQFFVKGEFPSMIFWGPPGSGKTTMAYLIADKKEYIFASLSAVDSGVKDVRKVISKAEAYRKGGKRTLLFIDEIHRFNKSQQDALLGAVEKGVITLVGATTENPSFEVISALLSRCQIYKLRSLKDDDIKEVVERAIEKDEVLSRMKVKIVDWDFLLAIAEGDARAALNAVELSLKYKDKASDVFEINREVLQKALQRKTAYYDKGGDYHYDTISAFIKSLRGSDPDAAMYWMAKMLDAGEDPKFIARRLVVFASEDIGNADPNALNLAISVFRAVEYIGMPECAINLAQGVTYLASCPKSNASYMALKGAEKDLKSGKSQVPPLHLRNAPTKLMKEEGYAENYKYPHDYEGHFVKENYFPEGFPPKAYYKPGDLGEEKKIRERLKKLWDDKRGR